MRRSILMNLALLCVKADLALEQSRLQAERRAARDAMRYASPHLLRDVGLDEDGLGRALELKQREALRLVCRTRQRHRWPRQR